MQIMGALIQAETTKRLTEARYAYYRRCQVLRGNGEQCKAPAEQGAHICYAHARQNAMQERRRRERQAVLEEAARRIRLHPTLRRKREGWGIHDFCAEDIFTDLQAIQVTLAVVMQAIIDGRIDDKTAGRLCWELQIASKLLGLKKKASTAARRKSSQVFRALDVPVNAAEQNRRPHATDLNDCIGEAGSASGWCLVVGSAPPARILPSDEKNLDRLAANEKAA